MKAKKLILLVFCIIMFSAVKNVSAGFIISDYGDCVGCLAFDATNNLEWLSPIYTAGRSYNEILGGWKDLTTTENFRLASAELVGSMFEGFRLKLAKDGWLPGPNPGIQAFYDVFTPTDEYGGYLRYRVTAGWLESEQTTKGYIAIVNDDRRGGIGGGYYLAYSHKDPYSYSKDWHNDPLGSWLIRDANPVPEPSTYALYAIGIGILGYIKRRSDNLV